MKIDNFLADFYSEIFNFNCSIFFLYPEVMTELISVQNSLTDCYFYFYFYIFFLREIGRTYVSITNMFNTIYLRLCFKGRRTKSEKTFSQNKMYRLINVEKCTYNNTCRTMTNSSNNANTTLYKILWNLIIRVIIKHILLKVIIHQIK
jgi:hypothetical protein